MRGFLPLIRKDSSTHIHGVAFYVKEGLPLARDLSLENSADSYWCFRLALLHSASYFFFLYRSPSSSLCTAFDSISSNIDKVLSVNPSTNGFVFKDFDFHHKDRLIYSGGTDWPGDIIIIIITIFLFQMTLLRWLTFLIGSQTVTVTVLLFWICLFLLTLVFLLQWLSLYWKILIMLSSQFPLTFHQIHNGMPRFIA